MRVVIAPDKFKGCLGALEVASAIADGLRDVDPAVEIDCCPMADGGEGIVAALASATGGRLVTRRVAGPLPNRTVDATFALLGDGQTAVVEMAAASGLALLSPEQRNPLHTSTYGTGQLLTAAAELGATKVILGIGGSATVDGGLGCAQACGAVFRLDDSTIRDAATVPLVGADVARIAAVERGATCPFQQILVACDVTNPLFGPDGAAPVFGPQKGATPPQVQELDAALQALARHTGNLALAELPGAGAAGGLGFGMTAFFQHVLMRSGIQIVMDAVQFPQRLTRADLCITGEGRVDSQSLAGKTAVGVARACKQAHVPCLLLAGSIGEGAEAALDEGVSALLSICNGPMSLEQAMASAPLLLRSTAANSLRLIRCSRA